jgi:glycosyltransferase involved in cell wall biosynthesis
LPGDYLLFFGRIHPDKGTVEAIKVASRVGLPLVMAGIIQDQQYFDTLIAPRLDDNLVRYLGPVGGEQRNELLGGALRLAPSRQLRRALRL